ncbi:MAG TPA: hypothetical protein VFT12_13810 [Thermoanaerobaculia bacterium]|nr:hypothetical protein [Thermoanaerobaculia bacterium]
MAINRRETLRASTTAFDVSQREQTDALLRDLGADEIVIEAVGCRIEDDDVQTVVSRLRDFAEENPRIVLGALSALIAGGAVVAGRAVAKKKSAQRRKAAASKAGRKSAKSRKSSKRTLIEPHPGDKRYIRRDAKGRIKESVDVGRSLAADRRRTSKTRSKPGAGDKGDR